MPLKRLFTFDQLPPDVQKKALERQGTCAHRIFTHPREHLVGAEGTFCHEGSRGFVENRVCIECGVNRGIYYTSVWKDGVPYELKYGETLRMGVLKLLTELGDKYLSSLPDEEAREVEAPSSVSAGSLPSASPVVDFSAPPEMAKVGA